MREDDENDDDGDEQNDGAVDEAGKAADAAKHARVQRKRTQKPRTNLQATACSVDLLVCRE